MPSSSTRSTTTEQSLYKICLETHARLSESSLPDAAFHNLTSLFAHLLDISVSALGDVIEEYPSCLDLRRMTQECRSMRDSERLHISGQVMEGLGCELFLLGRSEEAWRCFEVAGGLADRAQKALDMEKEESEQEEGSVADAMVVGRAVGDLKL